MSASITFWATTLHFWLIECAFYQHLVSFDCLFSSLQLSSLISWLDKIHLEGTCCCCIVIFLSASWSSSSKCWKIFILLLKLSSHKIMFIERGVGGREGGETQNSLSQPESSSEGTASSRGYLSKLEVSAVLWTLGRMGGVRLRVSRPSQSKP